MRIANLTYQQIAILVVCLAAAFLSAKYLGADAGMVAGVISSVVAFLLGRNPSPPAPPAVSS